MMLATALLALTLASASDDVDALRAAAQEAASAARYCDAHGYFQALFARTGELKHLYNAAEVARAAKDNVGALAAYRAVEQRAPRDFPERERVARVVTELEAALASGDLGTTCPAAPPLPATSTGEPEPASAPAPAPANEPAASPPPAQVVAERATPTLVVIGGAIAGAGTIAVIGFGAWAAVLESQLRTRAPDVTREQKDAALAAGWPVVLAATSGAVITGVGAVLVVMGLE